MAINSTAPGAVAQRSSGSTSLAELVSVILDKGIVIDAWARVSVIGIEILTVEARAVVASVDTYLRYAEAIGQTALAASPGEQQGQVASGGQTGQSAQAQLPSPDEVKGYLEDHPQGAALDDMQAYFDAPGNELANVVNELVADNKAREEQDRYFPTDGDEQEG